ncbi:asparagine synthase (glutamine-hydrolyzing) [Photorhabdus antumapuensis]|uniref:asparagine synthase (glutamine-hydrolyzing) n=1 Tax=Photorhabdus antumapuensis TaxID=2862867 RepID=UPI001CEDDA1C|nr:asparagine synthase (glutamine-hydrolyzing) [Photorhabdus antumapuensis]MCA6222475.1 asparagine synthase (glutamine-hydrolyzing) [Photorhabdus antumapuensis]
MCGISGYFNLTHEKIFLDNNVVSILKDSIKDRGPDFKSELITENFSLFFSQLSITGKGHHTLQPYSQNKTHVVYNGEIYNFIRLAKQYTLFDLEENSCDGQILIPLIRRMGLTKALRELNGAFALVMIDDDNIFLSRDILGKKPLYYLIQNGVLFFSSNVLGLMRIKRNIELNFNVIADYFMFKSSGYESSFIKGIFEVPAGGFLWFDRNKRGHVSIKYHSFSTEKKQVEDEEVMASLVDAVFLRSRHSRPIASLLSGGLDSSIINYLLKLSHVEFDAYTIGSDDGYKFDEIPLAKAFASQYGIKHTPLLLNEHEIPSLLEESVLSMEQPVQDPIIVNSLALAKQINKNHRVLITGDGADELWYGYSRYSDLMNTGWSAYFRSLILFTRDEIRIKDYDIAHYFGGNIPSVDIESVTRKEMEIRFKNYHLTRMDRIFMKNGIETRSPFLDPTHMQLAILVSSADKFQNGIGKYLLRKIFSSYLGHEISYRKKQPFTFQFHFLKNKEIFNYFALPLFDKNSVVHDYLFLDDLKNKCLRVEDWNMHDFNKLWSVKVFDLWYKNVYQECL